MKNKFIIICMLILPLFFIEINLTAQIISDFLVNEQGSIDGAQQSEPAIAGDGNGNYVVTWKDKRNGSDFDIFAQIYLSDGTPSGENFKINDDFSCAPQYEPTVAVDSNSNFVIAWIDRRNGDINTDWDIYAQRFSSDGIPLGNNFRVNDEQETDQKNQPSVSIDSYGNFVIVWSDKRSSPWDIYGQRYTSNGTALGNNFRINDDVGDYFQYWPTSACDNYGNLIVSWVDQRNNTDRQIYAQRFSPDGTVLGTNFKVNTDTEGTNHLRPDIAIDGEGNFMIVWEDNRNGYFDIYAQCYSNDGSILDDNFKINEDLPNTSQGNPSISMDMVGNFTVCWEDNRNDYNDVYARCYSNVGTPLSSDFKVNDDFSGMYQVSSVIAADENMNFMICWEDHRLGFNGEIFAQSYLNDGTAIDENFMVNDDEASENQQWPSIAIDENEDFVIVWADNRLVGNGIYAQRFLSNGTAIGYNLKVNDDFGDNWVHNPSVAFSLDGSFVITWSDFRSQSSIDIYAQRYSSDGDPVGNNFKVNSLSAWLNYDPIVVCKQNGDFIITWGDMDEGGDIDYFPFQNLENNLPSDKLIGVPDIWGQQYLNDGTLIGENFKVNDDGGYESQMNPDIAVDGDGDFVVTWEDYRNGIYEIYLQRYLSDGTPLGSNFTVEDVVYSDWQLSPSITSDLDGNFIITWRDDRNGNIDIFCRQFLNDGTPIENSFQVNSDNGIHYQSFPDISIQNDGRFIISWTDDRNGTYDVFAQRYSNGSVPYGDNFQVPSNVLFEQAASKVVLVNNRIFSTWHNNSSGLTGFDVWANILEWDIGMGVNENSTLDTPLIQNFPNPFSSETIFKFELKEVGKVKIEIYNNYGQKLVTLFDNTMNEGVHEVSFSSEILSNGIYYYRLTTSSSGNTIDFSVTNNMVILK